MVETKNGDAKDGEHQNPEDPTKGKKESLPPELLEAMKTEVGAHARAALQGVTTNVTKTIEDRFAKLTEKYEASLGEVKKILADSLEAQKKQGSDGGKGGPDPNFEITKLKKSFEESEARAAKLSAQLVERDEAAKAATRRGALQEALIAAKCFDTESAMLWADKQHALADRESDGAVVARVKDEYGNPGEISPKEYVERYVKPAKPHLFEGSNKAGSPAAGDQSGGAGGRSKWTFDQYTDTAFYQAQDAKTKAEMDADFSAGRLQNQPTEMQEGGRRRSSKAAASH